MERKHCPYCTQTFETLEALERHFKTLHETQPKRPDFKLPPLQSMPNKTETRRDEPHPN